MKEGSVSGGEKCLINIPPGSQLIILQPNSQVPIELTRSTTATTSTGVQSTPVCSMHVMAAVALSELASGVSQPVEKREFSTQTESSTPDVWLNLVQEGANRVIMWSLLFMNEFLISSQYAHFLLSRTESTHLARKLKKCIGLQP